MILFLMVGAPASGKTTIRNIISNKFNVTVICPDDLIKYTKESPWTPQAARNAWRESDNKLKVALENGDEFILFDATFVSRKKRSKYIKVAQQYGADVIALYCYASLNTVVVRNGAREINRQVPIHIIKNMIERLESPKKEEGFKQVFTFNSDDIKLYNDVLSKFLKHGSKFI